MTAWKIAQEEEETAHKWHIPIGPVEAVQSPAKNSQAQGGGLNEAE